MSIASSDTRPTSSDFAHLLAHHPQLARWLAEVILGEDVPAAETLLPSFLAECSAQGITDSAYPFILADQGLHDLDFFLQENAAELSSWSVSALAAAFSLSESSISLSMSRGQSRRRGASARSSRNSSHDEKSISEQNAVKTNKRESLSTASTSKDKSEQRKSAAPVSEDSSSQEPPASSLSQESSEVQSLKAEKELENPLAREIPATQIPLPPSRQPDISDVLSTTITDESTLPVASLEDNQEGPAVADFPISSLNEEDFVTPKRVLKDSSETHTLATAASSVEDVTLEPPETTLSPNASDEENIRSLELSGEEALSSPELEQSEHVNSLSAENSEGQDTPVEMKASLEENEQSQASTTLPPEQDSESALPVPADSSDTTQNLPDEVPVSKANLSLASLTSKWQAWRSSPRSLSWRSRQRRPRRPRSRRRQVLVWILLVSILASILVPAGFLINLGISAYSTYHQVSTEAHTAVGHLVTVKNLFSGGQSHLEQILDVKKMQQAQQEFLAADHDFQVLQSHLKNSETIATVVTYLPQYRSTLQSAEQASVVGIDVAKIGQIVAKHVIEFAPSFNGGSLLAPSQKPLITQPMLDTAGTTIDEIMPLLNDVEAHAQNINLDTLPIQTSEKTQLNQLLPLLPKAITYLGEARSLLGSAGWLLGVDKPRTFLVQTLDRAELRGTGGFTGQYGELSINGGRIGTFSLKDIAQVEYADTSSTIGQQAPTQYRDWWPFPNWGLRDSNISADFPTTAQLAINLYKQEVGDQVDGVISFTPTMIEHVLTVIGPVQVPGYKTIVTANNLEDVLHYYQLDNNGILAQINQTGNDASAFDVRKAFTSKLASLLMAKVRSSKPEALLAIGSLVLHDLKTKDLQVYFANPSVENVLNKYGYAGALNRSSSQDGLYVVQSNLSASKAAQYVKTLMHDTVTLDAQGGATHQLQVRLVYNQAGPVYGYDTYYDYMRIYVPENSHLLSADGFSSGTPLCGGSYGDCPVDNVYPKGELVCPAGQYQPGATPPNNTGSDGGTWMPLQTTGGPTNTTSDEPGRAMYGGWVVVPKNCTLTMTISWYVPPIGSPYAFVVQRQSGTFPELDLTILPTASACTKSGVSSLHVDQILTQDATFTPPVVHDTNKCNLQMTA